MTAAAQSAGVARKRSKRRFASVLLAIGLSLLALGVAGFGYLRVHSPVALLSGLLSGASRPIAAATVFVPRQSPFTISLLTRPERLISLQQAVASSDYRPRAEREVAQLQRSFKALSGFDYWQDILPWAGEEITFAYTSSDLDQDKSNGQQPGYLLAVEIAPGQQPMAQEFLQLFWQRQSLAGYFPKSQQVNGVPILSSATSDAKLMSATALVGREFVLFSNAAEVIRTSLHSAQTADNLAQNWRYRTLANQLSEPRIALAYLNTRLLGQSDSSRAPLMVSDSFAAISIGLTQHGLTADVKLAGKSGLGDFNVSDGALSAVLLENADTELTDNSTQLSMLEHIPDSSQLVIAGDSIGRLRATLVNAGIATNVLPDFLMLASPQDQAPWQRLDSGYGLAQLSGARGDASDWLLAVARTNDSVEALDAAAEAAGYSVVPVQIADRSAIAWTRFKASSRRRFGSALETELLGLHLQREDIEFFASSLDALEAALAVPERSIASLARFREATMPLQSNDRGYLYVDGPAAVPTAKRLLRVPDAVWRLAQPVTSHISAIAATPRNDSVSVFIQLHE
ncbi:MAG: DUF3352 domain-containing protein [Cyanobacteria bacterium J06560_6]